MQKKNSATDATRKSWQPLRWRSVHHATIKSFEVRDILRWMFQNISVRSFLEYGGPNGFSATVHVANDIVTVAGRDFGLLQISADQTKSDAMSSLE